MQSRWESIQMCCMEVIANSTEQPLVLLRIDSAHKSAKLVCSTKGAGQLLLSMLSDSQPNSVLENFLQVCLKQYNSKIANVLWRSPAGKTFRLTAKSNVNGIKGLVVVSFLEKINEPLPRSEDWRKAAEEMGLTPAETRVFAYMVLGLGNKDIASELKASVNTVRSHMRSIFRSLGVRNRLEAINAVRKRRLPSIEATKNEEKNPATQEYS